VTADKDSNANTGSKFIVMDKSSEFSYEELAMGTDNFSLANKIGQGGFGEVYYGELRGKVCYHQFIIALLVLLCIENLKEKFK
jgi:hypothetical protein